MSGPPPAIAEVRHAVRCWLRAHLPPAAVAEARTVTVAVSGGADSLALASAVLFETRNTAIGVHGITVDHQLQEGSAERARRVADWLREAGCVSAEVATVEVGTEGGPEAAARTARYDALAAAAHGPILLGHTLDDQAETVLLGLSRGSGPRSLRGMAPWQAPYGRPLLAVRRSTTHRYCDEAGLEIWDDPHNEDPRYTRVRLRNEALPLLEEILGGGVASALARTAGQLRDLDGGDTAHVVLSLVASGTSIDAVALETLPPGVRRDVLKAWLDTLPIGPSTASHVAALDRLVVDWHGQGPAYLPGGAKVQRQRGKIQFVDADVAGRAAPTHQSTED